jgi:hypothetical protein
MKERRQINPTIKHPSSDLNPGPFKNEKEFQISSSSSWSFVILYPPRFRIGRNSPVSKDTGYLFIYLFIHGLFKNALSSADDSVE